MELLKSKTKLKDFWVENYTDEDKEFFIGLGFTCDEFRENLYFHGSGSFGWWDDEQTKLIYSAVRKQYGKCRPRVLNLAERM